MHKTEPSDYLKSPSTTPLIDVRSPAEFAQGHIPGAVNMPLFSNRERKEVGICYKREGQKAAIKLGLRIVGPKMAEMVEFCEALQSDELTIHCWRGGMRSASVAWLLETYGFNVSILSGGYKAYRKALIEFFENPLPLIILGGKTGSGKTEILQKLEAEGEQIIDLEELANHKGSSFGSIGLPPQPTTEQFQNNIFHQMLHLDINRPIWLEDESSYIGKVGLPEKLWRQMSASPLVLVEIPTEERIDRLVREYGTFPKKDLEDAINRIGKKLGGQHKQHAISCLHEGKLAAVAKDLLTYYDKSYDFLTQKRKQSLLATISAETGSIDNIVEQLKNISLNRKQIEDHER